MNSDVKKFMEDKLREYDKLKAGIKNIDDMLNSKHDFVLTNYTTGTVNPLNLGFKNEIIELMIKAKEKLKKELEEL